MLARTCTMKKIKLFSPSTDRYSGDAYPQKNPRTVHKSLLGKQSKTIGQYTKLITTEHYRMLYYKCQYNLQINSSNSTEEIGFVDWVAINKLRVDLQCCCIVLQHSEDTATTSMSAYCKQFSLHVLNDYKKMPAMKVKLGCKVPRS